MVIIYVIRQSRKNPKKFWNFVNSKRKTNDIPNKIHYNGECATSNAEKSNLFAHFFQTVYVSHRPDNALSSFIDELDQNGCFNITASPEMVYSVLSRMDLSKGAGHNRVSSIFIRECADVLATPLCNIFNRSITENTYLAAFKIGHVTPIHKSGSRSDATNYRGVNVLPYIAKVFERVIYNQMKLIIPPRISSSQHGNKSVGADE